MFSHHRKQLVVVSMLAGTIISNISHGANFTGIGFIPNYGSSYSKAWGVSADGSVVVGRSSLSGARSFKWDAVNGMQDIGGTVAYAVSGDGSTITGHTSSQAFRWNTDTGMAGLGYLPLDPLQGQNISIGTGVSADGNVVGFGNSIKYTSGYEVFEWSKETGIVGLGINGRAEDISSDGSVIVGGANGQAFRRSDGNLSHLGVISGHTISGANSVSGDGNNVVGYSRNSTLQEAFLWDEATGMFGLGDLAGGGFYSNALDVSGDGSLVVGYSEVSSRNAAFIWDAENGMLSLQSVLSGTYGLNLSGWSLHEATGISEDGSTIIGWGINPDGNTEAWVANISTVPVPSAVWLFGSGLIGLIGIAKRKKA